MNRNDGGSAFPHDPYSGPTGGMSLRDYFAGQALTGVMNMIMSAALNDGLKHDVNESHLAMQAYIIADAMIAERAKGEDND